MPISTTQIRKSYRGDGSSTQFPIPFPFYLDTDITVLLGTAEQSSGYSITGGEDANGDPQTGTVIFSSAPASGVAIQVILDVPLTQLVRLVDGTAFPSDTLNQVNDRAIQAVLRMDDLLGRTMLAPDGDVSPNLALPSASVRANTYPVFDSNGNLSVAQSLPSGTLSQATIGGFLQPQTAAETAAGVTPANYAYAQGHLYRYGTNANPGVTDMTNAVKAWASIGGNLTIPVTDTILISDTISLGNNTSITMVQGATIKSATPNVSLFKALNKSNVQIRGGTIQQTATGAGVHIGVIELNGCTNCLIEGVEIIGAQWHGILLSGSSNNVVRGNNIHSSQGVTIANVDSADISCYGSSSFNIIDGNICYGGTAVEHGIMIQDPGSGLIPFKNTVTNNKVGPHSCYGILDYLIDHSNTYDQIIGNEVEGITGTALSGNSGMGIYIQGAGGALVDANQVRDCCKNTTAFSLIPAGITFNLDPAMKPATCTNNKVTDIVNGSACIAVTSGPLNIHGNTVDQSAGMITNIGIYFNTASNVKASGNQITIDPSIATSHGILSLAGANVANINITGNSIFGCSARHIRVDTSASFTTATVTVCGNMTSSTSPNCIPIELGRINNGAVSGNTFVTTGNVVVTANNAQQVSYTGNVCSGGIAAPQVIFAGTCNGSYWDKSNILGTFINNQGSGQICEITRSGTPTSTNSQVGDAVWQQVPIVGNPKGWRCTAAGNPGNWISEGPL